MKDIWHILQTQSYKKPYHVAKIYLAKQYLKLYPGIEIIGITGTVGKTTAKEAVAAVLRQQFNIKYSRANIDPVFNIPSTILSLRPGDEKLVLELGIEFPGDMAFYLSQIQPDVGVITKLSGGPLVHSQFFGSREKVIEEKSELVKSLSPKGVAILPWDDEACQQVAKQLSAEIVWFGWSNTCKVWAQDYQEQEDGSSFILHIGDQTAPITWQLIGKHSIDAALIAASLGHIYNMSIDKIKIGLESLISPPSRMNTFNYNGATIINDAYNASPIATVAALETLKARAKSGRAIAVLATMKELGSDAEAGHRQVGKKVAEIDPDNLVLWNELTEFIANEAIKNGYAKEKIIYAKSFDEIVNWLKLHVNAGDTVLVKGSRHHIHLERIALMLQGKSPTINCPVCPEC